MRSRVWFPTVVHIKIELRFLRVNVRPLVRISTSVREYTTELGFQQVAI